MSVAKAGAELVIFEASSSAAASTNDFLFGIVYRFLTMSSSFSGLLNLSFSFPSMEALLLRPEATLSHVCVREVAELSEASY